MPRITIVTPVLNRVALIDGALDSVASQEVDDVEHLVVDGGSTDGTREKVLARSAARLIDAPGTSIYEALNIGIQAGTGDIVGHLNSDDRLAPGTLARVRAAFAAAPNAEMLRGRAVYRTLQDNQPESPVPLLDDLFPERLDLAATLLGSPAINAAFVRKALYERIGLYDESLRIAADREWLVRALLAKAAILQIPDTLYVYGVHPDSLTIDKNSRGQVGYVQEHLTITRTYLRRPELSERHRRTFKRLHARETLRLALLRRRGAAEGSPWRALADGFTTQAAWPLSALQELTALAGRRLRRRLLRLD